MTAVAEREIKQLVQAITDGVAALAIKEELSTLEARKAALKMALTDPPVPAMHPRMAQVFQEKVSALCRGLENATGREEARAALRGLVDRIVIPEGDGLLRVEGNLGAMLATAHGRAAKAFSTVGIVDCGGSQPLIPTALYIVAA
jgi:hypothetical protein